MALLGFALCGCGSDEGSRPVPPGPTSYRVEIQTTVGAVRLELNVEKAPITVGNFLRYVDGGFYDGILIHRVIPDFVIQGGGFTEGMVAKPPTYPPIVNESTNGLRNERGTIGMARVADPNSATTQFFINLEDNTMLDYPNPDGHGYAVFGKVTDGMAVVDSIARVATGTQGGAQNVPIVPIVILSIRRS
jgi:peptidyl-prolyl cis-trans isomerase A (cyclophilin A)